MPYGRILVTVMLLSMATAAWAQGISAPQTVAGSGSQVAGDENLTDKAKLEKSTVSIKKMREVLTRLLAMLEEARKERDIVKINCVNEKLTAVKALLRIAEQADVNMQEAVVKNERVTVSHEYEKISIAYQKVMILKSEAEGCTGLVAWYPGETNIEIEEPKGMPGGDPTALPEDEGDFTRPARASPYQ
jgi:hypothetical protein